MEEQHWANLINQLRQNKGLDFFIVDTLLTDIARKHSKEMVDLNYLSEVSPISGTPLDGTQKAWISDYHSVAFVAKGIAMGVQSGPFG